MFFSITLYSIVEMCKTKQIFKLLLEQYIKSEKKLPVYSQKFFVENIEVASGFEPL